jgi:hypothetical protein
VAKAEQCARAAGPVGCAPAAKAHLRAFLQAPTDPPGSIRNGADLYQKQPIEGPVTRGFPDDGPFRKE